MNYIISDLNRMNYITYGVNNREINIIFEQSYFAVFTASLLTENEILFNYNILELIINLVT